MFCDGHQLLIKFCCGIFYILFKEMFLVDTFFLAQSVLWKVFFFKASSLVCVGPYGQEQASTFTNILLTVSGLGSCTPCAKDDLTWIRIPLFIFLSLEGLLWQQVLLY